jgi:endoribonuclease Dicer
MRFQELLFNGMFNKLIQPTKNVKVPDKDTYLPGNPELWSSGNMYLLLPLVRTASDGTSANLDIDWKSIRLTVQAAAAFIQQNSQERKQSSIMSAISLFKSSIALAAAKRSEAKLLHLAGGRKFCASEIVDTAVITIHTGKIYCVLDVLHHQTALTPFPETKGPEPQKFSNYSQFFKER